MDEVADLLLLLLALLTLILKRLNHNLLFCKLSVQRIESLLVPEAILVARRDELHDLCLRFLEVLVENARLLLVFRDGHGRFQLYLSDEELTVAELADFSAGFLPIRIDTGSGVHSLFVTALFAVALAAELAKLDLRVALEDVVHAAHASARSNLFPVRPVQEKDRVFLVHLKLVLADFDELVMPTELV